jgi:hypothetical protein
VFSEFSCWNVTQWRHRNLEAWRYSYTGGTWCASQRTPKRITKCTLILCYECFLLKDIVMLFCDIDNEGSHTPDGERALLVVLFGMLGKGRRRDWGTARPALCCAFPTANFCVSPVLSCSPVCCGLTGQVRRFTPSATNNEHKQSILDYLLL